MYPSCTLLDGAKRRCLLNLELTLSTSSIPFLLSAISSFPSSLLLPAFNLMRDVPSSIVHLDF
jgi:hypothetical protein